MMIYTKTPKSKRKLAPRAERENYEKWLASHKPTKAIKTTPQKFTYTLSAPAGREVKHIPSLNTTGGTATKSTPKVYTGTKVMGIATMHKSNAVPVFNNEEAVEISRMRR